MDSLITRVLCRRCFYILNSSFTGVKGQFGVASSRRLYPRVASHLPEWKVERSFSVINSFDKGSAVNRAGWSQTAPGWRLQTSSTPQPLLQFLLSRGYSTETDKELPKSQRAGKGKGPISWKGLVVIAGLGGIMLLGLQYVKREKELAIAKERSKSLGRARLGGDWELVDSANQKVSNKDLLGQWVLLYFGFTHCPDICPDELEKMAQVVDAIDALTTVPNILPVFITVDPERDTPAAVAEYVKEFSPKLMGLSGTKDQINSATRAYRVYYSMGPKDEDNDYIVDHTIIMYLVGPDGNFVDYFGQNKNAEQITSGIAMHMKKFAAMN
ncbi:Cu-binding protein [Nucella lapillus]